MPMVRRILLGGFLTLKEKSLKTFLEVVVGEEEFSGSGVGRIPGGYCGLYV